MRISFRLAEILKQRDDFGRGSIKKISEATSLERHQVAAVLTNKAKYVSMETLAALSEYLVKHHQIPPADVPGIMFRVEAEHLSSLMADRDAIEVFSGVRTVKKPGVEPARPGEPAEKPVFREESVSKRVNEPSRRWIVASDFSLQGVLLDELFSPANAKRPNAVEQVLVSAYTTKVPLEKLRAEAAAMYERFHESAQNRGLIGLGSVKSNVVIEALVASAFGASAFVSQDSVAHPSDRSVPFFLRYKEDDPQPPSCHAGLRLAQSAGTAGPGIHYATANGWEYSASNDVQDAALVFYTYHTPLARLEMVMGGFSGRATQCLANKFRGIIRDLWPPTYDNGEFRVGAFVVEFEFHESRPKADDVSKTDWMFRPSRTRVIPIEGTVLAERCRRKPRTAAVLGKS